MKKRVKRVVLVLFVVLSKGAFALSQVQFSDAITRFLQDKMAQDKTPGVVLLVSSPKLGIKEYALGKAVLGKRSLEMTADLNFRVASISKTFLAVMILKMAEQGKINLSDRITRYLPESLDISQLPNVDRVRVKDLLRMSSGIPEYYDVDVDEYLAAYPYKQWRPRDAVRFASDLKPKFKPGRGYEYSNTNYALLQLILREVSGKKLAQNLQSLICEPLGLKHTFADDFKMSPFTLTTKGYDSKRKELDVSGYDDGFGIGDTFVITNARDLNTFLQALFLNKTLLSEKALKKMLWPNPYGQYGMGVEINPLRGWGLVYSHNGLVNGYQTNYFYLPDSKLAVIILTNNRATKLIEPTFLKVLSLYTQLN